MDSPPDDCDDARNIGSKNLKTCVDATVNAEYVIQQSTLSEK